jgi:hypothetical protein
LQVNILNVCLLRYVDPYRSVSTELGGSKDLKDKMASMRGKIDFSATEGVSDEMMHIRQVLT